MLRDVHGERLGTRPVAVESLVAVIEVKDQGDGRVRVLDDQVMVSYSRGGPARWKSATDQNVDQLHALKAYFADRGSALFVRRCLVLPSLSTISAPTAVPGNFDGHQLLTAIAASAPVQVRGGRGWLSAGDQHHVERALSAPIFSPIIPTALDRNRMDRLVARGPAVGEILEQPDKALVVIRGHGGTGKTVALLQAAWSSFQADGKRTLFLTYNHALAADVRRLMALLGVPSSPEEGGISVETVMSFMYRWFSRLRLLEDDHLDFEKYPQLCDETFEMITGGAVSPEDIRSVIDASPDQFDFDQVFVDEGQDWPQAEMRLLKALYAAGRVVVADGVDQLVRGGRTDWMTGTAPESRHVIGLRKCLRMKRNLSIFVAQVADFAGLGWDIEPNDVAGGGRVILLTRPYESSLDLHAALVAELRERGNAEIDMLFCVPPSDVLVEAGARSSTLAKTLSGWGGQVWDGVNTFGRKDFPRSPNQFRVVQYESCRGLEGWTVVLKGFDEFVALKELQKLEAGLTSGERDGLGELESIAKREAYRWGLIALTRPISTLVVQLSEPRSFYSRTLLELSEQMPDIVEVM